MKSFLCFVDSRPPRSNILSLFIFSRKFPGNYNSIWSRSAPPQMKPTRSTAFHAFMKYIILGNHTHKHTHTHSHTHTAPPYVPYMISSSRSGTILSPRPCQGGPCVSGRPHSKPGPSFHIDRQSSDQRTHLKELAACHQANESGNGHIRQSLQLSIRKTSAETAPVG